MCCLIERYLTGTFRGMYNIFTQCFNRSVEGLGDLSVYSHLLFLSIWKLLELLF